jgi:uncharacterized protein YukE
MSKYVRAAMKHNAALKTAARNTCRTEVHIVKGRFHDMTVRAVHMERTLQLAEKRQERTEQAVARADQEMANYAQFRTWNSQDSRAWSKFWKRGLADVNKVNSLLAGIGAALKNVAKHARTAALIQLPAEYESNLTEIRTEFENTFDHLEGLRPVITDLLEIAKKPKNLNNRAAVSHMRRLVRFVQRRLHDQMNFFEEENEAQEGLFEAMTNLFGDAYSASSKVAGTAHTRANYDAKKITWMHESVKGSNTLANDAREIVDLFAAECAWTMNFLNDVNVRNRKFLGVVSQVEEVMVDRWGSLKGFFIQRANEQEEKTQ